MASTWTILHAGALGDLVLAFRFFEALVEDAGNTRVIVASRADPGDLSVVRPSWCRVSLETIGAHWLYSDSIEPPDALRKSIRDRHVLSQLSAPDTPVPARLRQLGAARVISVDPKPAEFATEHITEQWRRRAEPQRTPSAADRSPPVTWPSIAASRNSTRARGATEKIDSASTILIHPGAGATNKCWPLEAFVNAAQQLAQSGFAVRFVIGEVEQDRWAPECIARLQETADLVSAGDIDDLRRELSQCSALLGNDSGPAHLAAWLGIPTLALFGPTDARVWRPLGRNVRTLQGDPARDPAAWNLDVDTVVSALRNLLDHAYGS